MGTRCSWRHRSRLSCGLLVCIHMLLCVSSVSAQACEGNPPAVDNNAWNCEGTGSGAMCQGRCHAGALQPTLEVCFVVCPAAGHCMHASDSLHRAAARRSGPSPAGDQCTCGWWCNAGRLLWDAQQHSRAWRCFSSCSSKAWPEGSWASPVRVTVAAGATPAPPAAAGQTMEQICELWRADHGQPADAQQTPLKCCLPVRAGRRPGRPGCKMKSAFGAADRAAAAPGAPSSLFCWLA